MYHRTPRMHSNYHPCSYVLPTTFLNTRSHIIYSTFCRWPIKKLKGYLALQALSTVSYKQKSMSGIVAKQMLSSYFDIAKLRGVRPGAVTYLASLYIAYFILDRHYTRIHQASDVIVQCDAFVKIMHPDYFNTSLRLRPKPSNHPLRAVPVASDM